jgi:hypothetical protein
LTAGREKGTDSRDERTRDPQSILGSIIGKIQGSEKGGVCSNDGQRRKPKGIKFTYTELRDWTENSGRILKHEPLASGFRWPRQC